jgi:hypothetical protein
MMTLTEYLDHAASVPWGWGSTMDCIIFPSDWVKVARGLDPAERYRGRYSTADEAQALIRAEGGYVPMVRYEMDRLGLEETFSPKDGDVGVIMVDVQHYQHELPVCGAIGAIRCGGLWVARAAFGLRAGSFTHLAAWTI